MTTRRQITIVMLTMLLLFGAGQAFLHAIPETPVAKSGLLRKRKAGAEAKGRFRLLPFRKRVERENARTKKALEALLKKAEAPEAKAPSP